MAGGEDPRTPTPPQPPARAPAGDPSGEPLGPASDVLGAGPGRLADSLRAAFEESARLRDEVRRVRDSARYHLGALVLDSARPSREVLRLPRRLLALYRRKHAEHGTPELEAEETDAWEARLSAFAADVRRRACPWVVFAFTGTRLGGIRANRPFAMTRVLEGRGVPVLFGHAGPSDASARAGSTLELPEHFLAPRLEAIARLDLGPTKKIFWVSYPTPETARALHTFHAEGWATVYDALDDWEAFARAGVGTWFSPSIERYLVANADRTTVVSAPLVEKLEPFAGRVRLSPNALDPTFVPPGHRRRPASPPRVGYFGHLTPAWFDWEAVAAIARARPGYTFELIGHGDPRGLALPENVHRLGPRPPGELPGLAERWSAAIIPFRVGPLSRAVDPIKIYEYLALGLPTVSFTMPQIAGYPGTATVADVPAFLEALDRAVTTRLDPAEVARFLAENTWARRVDMLLEGAAADLAARGGAWVSGTRPALIFRGLPEPETGVFAFLDLVARVARRVDVEAWVLDEGGASEAAGRTLLGVADALGLGRRFRWFPGLGPEATARALASAGARGGAEVVVGRDLEDRPEVLEARSAGCPAVLLTPEMDAVAAVDAVLARLRGAPRLPIGAR